MNRTNFEAGVGRVLTLLALVGCGSSARDDAKDGRSAAGSGGTTAAAGSGPAAGTGGFAGSPAQSGGSAGATPSTGGAGGLADAQGGESGNVGSGAGGGGVGGDAGGGSGASAGAAGHGAGAAGSSPAPLESGVIISAPGDYWQVLPAPAEVSSGEALVTVGEAPAQSFEGFGGIFHEAGWSFLSQLPPAERERALELLFGEDGCHLAFGRIPIGASDFSLERYTEDDTADDYALEHFSIERDRQYLIPYIEAARAVRPDLRLWASPWTPPAWMKVAVEGEPAPSFDRGTMKNDSQTLGSYARYLTKFLQAYEQAGIPIEALAPQTDPLIEDDIPSCGWSAETFATFIGQHLGPTLASEGMATTISLSAIGRYDKATAFVDAVTSDSVARPFIGSVGLVWDVIARIDDFRALDLPLPLIHTQHHPGNFPLDHVGADQGIAPNDHDYAVESWGYIRRWLEAGAVSYMAGNLVLDKVGHGNRLGDYDWAQNALLVVDGEELIVTPVYYVFRHVSAFLRPGAKVLPTTGGDALAFRNPDGSSVIVIYNFSSMAPAIVAVGGRMLQIELPENGWATIIVGAAP
jgi:glucosylceramidase